MSRIIEYCYGMELVDEASSGIYKALETFDQISPFKIADSYID
jgi:hypothetical protein